MSGRAGGGAACRGAAMSRAPAFLFAPTSLSPPTTPFYIPAFLHPPTLPPTSTFLKALSCRSAMLALEKPCRAGRPGDGLRSRE